MVRATSGRSGADSYDGLRPRFERGVDDLRRAFHGRLVVRLVGDEVDDLGALAEAADQCLAGDKIYNAVTVDGEALVSRLGKRAEEIVDLVSNQADSTTGRIERAAEIVKRRSKRGRRPSSSISARPARRWRAP